MNNIVDLTEFLDILLYININDIVNFLIISKEIYNNHKIQLVSRYIKKSSYINIQSEIANTTNTTKLLRLIFIYNKIIKYYRIKKSGTGKNIFISKNPVSIYEILAKVLNYTNYYNKYNKMTKTKILHEKRTYGYSFHTLSQQEMNIFTYEISQIY